MKIRNTFILTIWLTTFHILLYFLPGFLYVDACVSVCLSVCARIQLCICEFSQNKDPIAL